MSCMSLKTFDSLKLNLTKERFPLVVTATGSSMDPIGFTQCTFFITRRSFTQKFIVCTNQTRPVILGKDFAARNCIGVVWTKQGSRRMVDDYNTTIMEVFEQTKDVPLSLANPIRIPPRSVVVALVECNRPLHAHMDIKGDAGFLREYPNIHVSRTYINNLPESSNCMPFSFTNLSMHSQYLGKDKVVGFAESTTDEVEVHELADYDEIKEMMRGTGIGARILHQLCKLLNTNYANGFILVCSTSYAGCFCLVCWFSCSFVSEACTCFGGCL